MKMNSVLAWLTLAMLLVLGGCSHTSYLESDDIPEDDTEAAAEEEIVGEDDGPQDEGTLFVQVAGAVKSPGVYELAQGARVFEAIELAGGLKKDADDVNLNQASPLVDGEKIYVYRVGELEEVGASGNGDGLADSGIGSSGGADGALSGGGNAGAVAGGGVSGAVTSGSSGTSADGRVNINTAGVEDLKTLSGIGDAKAQAIISYREANGGFQSVDELTKVDGIGDATLQKLKDYITI